MDIWLCMWIHRVMGVDPQGNGCGSHQLLALLPGILGKVILVLGRKGQLSHPGLGTLGEVILVEDVDSRHHL